MDGGINNPLGARALYIGATLYRIHGTNEPWTIGGDVSLGLHPDGQRRRHRPLQPRENWREGHCSLVRNFRQTARLSNLRTAGPCVASSISCTRFRRDESGVFVVLFAVLALVLIATSGAVVDFTYMQTARTRAQTALDAAALALQTRIRHRQHRDAEDRRRRRC